jgi:dipeptidyl aminopeptidase/acylaminoacyl peptidase
MKLKSRQILFALFPVLAAAVVLFGATTYQKPPKEVLDILNAPETPQASVSPAGDQVLLINSIRYPSIADMARPMLRLAGLRINPDTNGIHGAGRITELSLVAIGDGSARKIELPPGFRGSGTGFGGPMAFEFMGPRASSWSADGKYIALTNETSSSTELWIIDTAAAKAHKIAGLSINAAYGTAYQWMPDQRSLLVQAIPAGRGKPPAQPTVPTGPNIQENYGRQAPVWTFEDLLDNAHDEDLFDFYATAQLGTVDVAGGKFTPWGKPGIFQTASPSPDGKMLLVARVHRPYSYIVTHSNFPKDVEVWDRSGSVLYTLARLPLQEQVMNNGVPVGPREYEWRPTEPATLTWVEALDEGNPRAKVPYRDKVMMFKAPFKSQPVEMVKTEFRFGDLSWSEAGGPAFLTELDRNTRWRRTWLIDADKPGATPRKIWDLSQQDRYGDPGLPMTKLLADGQRVIIQKGNSIFLTGAGSSPQGDRPFLDIFDLSTLQKQRIYQCPEKSFETILALLNSDGTRFVTRFETPAEPPNIFVRSRDGSERRALTQFKDPTPQIRGITKQLVTYKRPDGVDLSFTLYLPAGYKPGQRLPTVMWAYPREYSNAAVASQITGSPYRFTTMTGPTHLFFLTQGYAVLDDAALPVVGDSMTVNETYVEQIVAGAKAAIDKAASMGVTDPNRVGVGGHSYGAFMTANLLTHSNLFKAGIARSGAYNRTLTPFGFQQELRTFWEAPDLYFKMSPFMHVTEINTPILLIHGERDNNSGTFPIQSERYYMALKGNGKTVRYVTLPLESHGYAGRESIEHVLYEQIAWFDKYVKNAGK